MQSGKIFLLILLFNCMGVQAKPAVRKDSRPLKPILLLVSYHMSHTWTEQLTNSIKKNTQNLPVNLDFDIIECDSLRSSSHDLWASRFKQRLPSIKDNQYAMIVTLDDTATELVLEYAAELPAGLPVVFAGFENYTPELRKKYPALTGVTQNFAPGKTIRSALTLYPDTREILILADIPPIAMNFDGIKISYLNPSKYSQDAILEKVSDLPDNTLIFLIPWRGVSEGSYRNFSSFAIEISDASRHPFFVGADTLIGYGALGGYLTMAEEHGRETAAVIGEVFRKGGAIDVPVISGTVRPVFDYNILMAENLDPAKLPSGAYIVNQPQSPWTFYRTEILMFSGFALLLLLGIIGAFFFSRRILKRTLKLFESLPGRVGVCDRNEKIKFIHFEDTLKFDQEIRYLCDIPGIDYKKVSTAFAEVFATGKTVSMEYDYNNMVKRAITIAPLQRNIFGTETIIWLSHDNTDLQEIRTKAEALAQENRLNLEKLQDLFEEYQLFLDNMPAYMLTKDIDDNFRITSCNRFCGLLLDCPIEQIVGRFDSELFADQEESAAISAADRIAVETNELYTTIHRYTGADGKPRIGNFLRKVLKKRNGQRLLFMLMTDITELRNAQKLAEESADQLRSTLLMLDYGSELTRMAAFKFDPVMNRLSGSRLLPEMWPMQNGVPLSRKEWVFPDDQEKFDLAYQNLLMGKDKIVTVDFRSNFRGDICYYRIRASVDQANPGTPQIIGVMQDVTELTRSTWKLRETQELWDLIINSIPVMIFAKRVKDDFRYLLSNRAFETFVGQPSQNLIGRNDAELFHLEKDAEWFRAKDRKIMDAGHAEEFIESPTGADGIRRHLRTTKIPFTDADGEPLLLGVSVDITELNAFITNEKALNSCMEIFFRESDLDKAMVEILKIVSVHLGTSRSFILQFDLENNCARTVAEYAAEGITPVVFNYADSTFGADEEWLEKLLRHEILSYPDLNKPAARAELGSWYDFSVTRAVRSMYNCGIYLKGKLWGEFGVIYEDVANADFTEINMNFLRANAHLIELIQTRQQSQEQIIDALHMAQAADKAKSFFLASMSHEIRTPLNAVIGFTELLRDGELDAETQQDYLNNISNAGNALLGLINDVLDLSKLEAGQMVFTPVETDFAELANEISNIFQPLRQAKELSNHNDIAPMPLIYIDKLRLRQILFNLMGNALKFTTQGSVDIAASFCEDTPETGTLTVSVVDTGIGITIEDQKHLFEPFVQSKAMRGTHAANSGTGLGLAIIKRMLTHMNGKITLTSELGKGSCFTVILSRVPYSRRANIDAEPTDKTPPETPPCSVLLVDDVPMNLKVQGAMLRKLGVAVITAGSADEALKLLDHQRFDLILTDLWMPEMNGADFAKILRNRPDSAKIPIAAITADIENYQNFDMTLFDAIITKPATLEKLRALLSELLREKR